MAPQMVRLPNGQNITVTPVFSGLFFKTEMLCAHTHAYPIGWTIVLNTHETDDERDGHSGAPNGVNGVNGLDGGLNGDHAPHPRIRPYASPTLQSDNLFISSISIPSSAEYKPPASPTRQIAMMLWITLYWYFHQPEPSPHLTTSSSRHTPEAAKPRGEWRVNVRRDGVLRGRNVILKLERMGLLAALDDAQGDEWDCMFVSRRMFWQIPGRLFLFSLEPRIPAHSLPGSPVGSRPGTPQPLSPTFPHHLQHTPASEPHYDSIDSSIPMKTVTTPSAPPPGPFHSTSHLPTYYPPPPLSYTTTNSTRHPRRPRAPRPGEVFYTRYVPSASQYLSFRAASTSPTPIPYHGPTTSTPPPYPHLARLSDTSLLRAWLSNPRVSKFWGTFTDDFLPTACSSRHSFPVIGMWDGVPFGFFEIYWVKEDRLGNMLGSGAGDFDRGLHVIIGEEWARGRVPSWLSSLVHWCFTADYRTMSVVLEPRVDNERYVSLRSTLFYPKEEDCYEGACY